MAKVRFLMVGGFLGAGKTTAIARLAHHFIEQGHQVGVVTNDQAFDLVDTFTLRDQGLSVAEVPGACFCCRFNELVDVASRLAEEELPDVILAEPVGSCTDLVSTVIEPLRQLYHEQFEVGPLAVLLKPEHGRKILSNDGRSGFSSKAAYIFLKQLEEADIIVVHKIDKLADEDRDALMQLVAKQFPDKLCLPASSKTGEGFSEVIAAICRPSEKHTQFMDVDYDIYAAGEAELGWLNCTVRIGPGSKQEFALDAFLLELIARLQKSFLQQQAEPAHLKIFGETGQSSAVANLVDSASGGELSKASDVVTVNARLVVNARVAIAPEPLEQIVETAVAHQAAEWGLTHALGEMQCFRPGRPVPTHRITAKSAE